MKPFLLVIVIGATIAHATADEVKSIVRFANGDQLSGSMDSLTTERLVWNSPILEKPTPFFLKSVLDLKLTATQPKSDARHEATVSLTNGDTVRGQLASISDDAVELDTWYAGRMKFRRVMIAEIQVDQRPMLLYQGPEGIGDWTQTEEPRPWSFRDSSFLSTSAGGIAKDVGLPDECSISFTAGWRGTFALKLNFFSDDIHQDSPDSGYSMTFQQRSITVQSGKNQMTLGLVANATALQQNEKAKIEVRASAKSGQIGVFIEGKCIALWKDADVATNKIGRGIHFITLNSSPVKISNIRVAAWDGVADEVPEMQPAAGIRQFGGLDMEDQKPLVEEKPKKGRMLLRSGDSLAGEVVAITGDMITIKTPFKEVRLPVEVLKSVALKPVDLERCKRENGDVRGWFPDGSSVVFKLEAVGEDGTVSGTNQNFGAAKFKIEAFSRVEFNIYDPKLETIRNSSEW